MMQGLKKCPPNVRLAYIQAVEGHCEECPATENLEIHRIKQGYNGGTYKPSNCKVLCNKHHKLLAENW